MFRIVAKIPKNDLSRKYQNGSFRLYKNVRQYSKDKDKDICPPQHPKSSGGTGTIYTIGALALLSGGTIGFAKYNPDFRDWLKEQAPFTDNVIKFIFQEEKSFYQSLMTSLDGMKNSLLTIISVDKYISKEEIKEEKKEYYPPSPAFKELVKDTKEDSYTEIRLEKKVEDAKEVMVEIAGDPKEVEQTISAFDPRNLVELETKIGLAVSTAIKALHKAKYAILNYNQDVEAVLDDSTHKLSPSVWNAIKEKGKNKADALKEAEDAEAEANDHIKQLRTLLNKKDFKAPPEVIERAKHNMQLLVEDLAKAKKEFENQVKSADLTNKYWNKVKESREFFAKELEILFPHTNFQEQKLDIKEDDLDIFLIHAVSKVLHYQKQIAELETVHDARLKSAIEQARRTGNFELLTTEQLCAELEKAKRRLEIEYHDKCLKLKLETDNDLRHKLKVQSQAFTDHLADALKLREEELKRMVGRDFDEKLTEERCRFKAQVAAMVGRLKGMDDAFKDILFNAAIIFGYEDEEDLMEARADADKMARNAQVLWSACQALYRSLKSGCPGRDWKDQIRPLNPELTAVEKAAAKEDELVKVVLDGIPQVARNRGVYPEDALRERFLKVEKVARTLALVPDKGARLHIYILSYIQSLLLLKAANPIPQAELNDEEVDFKKLSTNEILQRARYWIDRGDFMQTLKYMSLLKGASRVIASQWMEEARLMLETQQAANTLMAHAAASGLLYL